MTLYLHRTSVLILIQGSLDQTAEPSCPGKDSESHRCCEQCSKKELPPALSGQDGKQMLERVGPFPSGHRPYLATSRIGCRSQMRSSCVHGASLISVETSKDAFNNIFGSTTRGCTSLYRSQSDDKALAFKCVCVQSVIALEYPVFLPQHR